MELIKLENNSSWGEKLYYVPFVTFYKDDTSEDVFPKVHRYVLKMGALLRRPYLCKLNNSAPPTSKKRERSLKCPINSIGIKKS